MFFSRARSHAGHRAGPDAYRYADAGADPDEIVTVVGLGPNPEMAN